MTEKFLTNGGEMGALIRSHDWSQTPLGAVENWSQSLRTSVSICLSSRFPILIWWGTELTMLYNDAYRPILGTKHPKAMGQRGQECWSEIWQVIGPMLQAVLTSGSATWSENQLLLLDRYGYLEECYFTFSYSPIADETGGIGGVFTAVTETTGQVIGERRLQTLHNLAANVAGSKTLKSAYQSLIATLAQNTGCIPFALLYRIEQGGKQAEIVGATGLEVGTSASPQVVDLTYEESWQFGQVQATGQSRRVENLMNRFGGVFGENGANPNAAIVMPITQAGSKKVTEFLVLGISRRLAFDLEYQGFFNLVVANIETAIANAKASEAERKRVEDLAEFDRAKTVFFSNVSHEFRTPLTLMLGPTEDALSDQNFPLPAQQRERIEVVQRNGQRLLKLVNTLLDFSRIEAGRIQAVYEPTDLAAYTAELASVFRSASERAGLRLLIDCPASAAPAYIDRQMWEKIVLNLLSNAFKFTFEGEIAVMLRERNGQIELEVRDTGIGIPTSELPQIFQRFHQVRGARGRTYEGSGIGLSLVQELVQLHGGTIHVSSVVGQGTRFIVSIEAGSAHLPPEQIGRACSLVSTATGAAPYVEEVLRWLPEENSHFSVLSSQLTSESITQNSFLKTQNSQTPRILLVDDNTDMRNYVIRLLLERGYAVESAADGMEALVAMRQQVPDLVVTDVMMPRLDGFGLLRSLRTDPATRDIPIILLSARAGEEARIEGLKAGADDYLTKPFSARELLARVEANLKLAQLRRDAMQQEQALRQEAETAKQQVETILSSINDGFYVLDRDWRFTYVNDIVCEMVGMQREQMLGQTIWDLFTDLVDTDVYVQFHRALNEQTPNHAEYFYPRWNRWYEHRTYPSPSSLTVFAADITDRKLAQDALRQNQEQTRNILESINDGFLALDQSWRFTYVNRAAEVLLNCTPGNLIGKNFWEEFPGLAGSEFEQLHRRVANERVALSVTAFYPDHDRWYEVRTYPAANGITIYFQNVTDRIQASAALRESQERLQQAMSIETVGVIFFNTNGSITNSNHAFLRMSGYSREDMEQGRVRWDTMTALEFMPASLQAIEQLKSTGRTTPYEKEYIRKDGSRWWGLFAASRLTDNEWVEFIIDISDRKRAEDESKQAVAALAQANNILQAAIEGASDAIFVKDLQGRYVIVNPTAADWLNTSVEAILGQDDRALFPPDIAQHIMQSDQQVMQSGASLVYEEEIPRQGSLRSLMSAKYPWRNAEGEILGVIGISRDIHDRVQIERSRERILQQEQAAREEADRANRLKDEFLAVLSHELRSPLNPILGWTRLLQTNKLTETRKTEALAIIERNAKLQSQLIEDLLDISRIMQGKLTLRAAAVNLACVISAATETVRLAVEAKKIHLELDLNSTVEPVWGDATRLQQVVWNLLTNAVKFTPNQGQITVQLNQVNRQAQLRVSDTGKGINPQFLPYVFDYFRQEDGSTTRRFGGLGLGLAIVRQIVELHGGTVSVDSFGEDMGATFTVQLPTMQPASALSAQSDRSESKSIDAALTGIHVLVVDDDIDTREFQAFLLEQSGAEVTAVASGSEALQVFERFIPDILLSDVGMADMDGYMLIQSIRSRPPAQGGRIPAIALTAYAAEFDRQKALQAGFQQHLSKPLNPEILIQAITRLI